MHTQCTYIYIYNKKERERKTQGESVKHYNDIYKKRLTSKRHCFIPGKRVGQTNFPAKSLHLLYNIYIWLYVTQDIRYDYSTDYSQQYPNHLAFPFILSHELSLNYLYIYVICTHTHNCIKFQ